MTDQLSQAVHDRLEPLQRAAFGYFLDHANPSSGLVADTSRAGAPASIAVVGFALTCYPIGVERGWMSRSEAASRTLKTLQFFWKSEQSRQPRATGYKGFFYHFLDMATGQRVWQSELSTIDTALLLAGVLVACVYFDGDCEAEAEIRSLADALYARIDWGWACRGKMGLKLGWKPNGGFLRHGWTGYDEATLLFILGLASPSHALPPDIYTARAGGYQWKSLYGRDVLYAGPLFIHQFSHVWIDFDGIRDRFMREKDSDYFQNSRQATYVQREYARQNPHDFVGYGDNVWGLSAGEGPGALRRSIHGTARRFFGYAARGAPFGPDDGTINPCAIVGSLPFAPDIVLSALNHLCVGYPEIARRGTLPSGFNLSFQRKGSAGWMPDMESGLDQGIVVTMIENHRSGLIWRLMRRSPHVAVGLRRAGFAGGWLS